MHNQRIERHFGGYALLYVFIPHLNMQLDVFRTSYCHHRMRIANNLSPFQLWARGLIERDGDDHALDGLLEESVSHVISSISVY